MATAELGALSSMADWIEDFAAHPECTPTSAAEPAAVAILALVRVLPTSHLGALEVVLAAAGKRALLAAEDRDVID
jgi:hypothetical protein